MLPIYSFNLSDDLSSRSRDVDREDVDRKDVDREDVDPDHDHVGTS